jgi:hypothetical protein
MAPAMIRKAALAIACILGISQTGRAQSQWHRRFSVEFAAETAAIQSGHYLASDLATFFAGYGFESGVEREVRRGLTAGISLSATAGLAPGACASDLVRYDTCDDPKGRSIGAFATLRQYIPRSVHGAHLAANAGAGMLGFDGFFVGRRVKAFGPAIEYGAEAETGALWRVSFMVAFRGHLVADAKDTPLQVNALSFGFRAR